MAFCYGAMIGSRVDHSHGYHAASKLIQTSSISLISRSLQATVQTDGGLQKVHRYMFRPEFEEQWKDTTSPGYDLYYDLCWNISSSLFSDSPSDGQIFWFVSWQKNAQVIAHAH